MPFNRRRIGSRSLVVLAGCLSHGRWPQRLRMLTKAAVRRRCQPCDGSNQVTARRREGPRSCPTPARRSGGTDRRRAPGRRRGRWYSCAAPAGGGTGGCGRRGSTARMRPGRRGPVQDDEASGHGDAPIRGCWHRYIPARTPRLIAASGRRLACAARQDRTGKARPPDIAGAEPRQGSQAQLKSRRSRA